MSCINDIEDIHVRHDDKFAEVIHTNPYITIDYEQAKNMNRITSPDKLITPFGNIDMKLLKEYLQYILSLEPETQNEYNIANRQAMKKFKKHFKKTELLYMYKTICHENNILESDIINGFLQSKSYRSQSGVMVYAVFTHPFWKSGLDGKYKSFSCKYNCTYCPEQPGRPRSYVDGEPGLDRARNVDYNTVKQVHTRANSYRATGHINDKAEVIVLGGTWHSYPLEYRREFIRDLYYAFNTVNIDRDRQKQSMINEIKLNQESKCRIIGITIETRPDQINPKELKELRRMGITRVQLGIQHTNDRILKRIKRRCTTKQAINAIKLLKDCCFKIDVHLMPDLPKPFTLEFEEKNKTKLNSKNLQYTLNDIDTSFNSVAEDIKMFDTVLHGNDYCPDQIKIYPCEVMDWTDIKNDYDNGLHKSYSNKNIDFKDDLLVNMLINVKERIPKWIRINRLIRDIPEAYIFDGISNTNGRQIIENIMKDIGLKCNCIRCREIKKKEISIDDSKLEVIKYRASDGDEYFLQYVTSNDDLIGFLRLRLSDNAGIKIQNNKQTVVFDELLNTALIRELHVYGETVSVSSNKNSRTHQHIGFGTRLLQSAFDIIQEHGYNRVAVIAGEGVKQYYRKFGFVDGEYFMIKTIVNN